MDNDDIISVNIEKTEKGYYWSYGLYLKNWIEFKLKEKKFLSKKSKNYSFPKESIQKINDLFYEVVRQLKYHPSYRLKVMNMLDDEIRKVWNIV